MTRGKIACVVCAGLAISIASGQTGNPGAPGEGASPAPERPLDFRDRYDQLLRELRDVVRTPGLKDEDARAAAASFMKEAAALPGGVIFLREADEFVSRLREELERAPGAPAAAGDATRIGPGTLPGVEGVVVPGQPARVRFEISGKSVAGKSADGGEAFALEFVRVDVPGRPTPTWIGASEISVAQFEHIIDAFGSWDELAKLMAPFMADQDERLGARVWNWRYVRQPGKLAPVARGFVAADSWTPRSEGALKEFFYAEGIEPGTPTLDMPMQHLPPDAAAYAASLVGARLPTSEEWRAAQGEQASAASATANVRDATFARQYEHVRSGGGRRLPSPDAGAFVNPDANSDGKGADAASRDDGVLWFREVGRLPSGEISAPGGNLVGNVAEWVFDGPQDSLAGADAWTIRATLDRHAQDLGIIGGSALSPVSQPVDKPARVVLGEAREGYADVGFRLAFTGTPDREASLAERIAGLLDPLPTLKRDR